MLNDTRQTKSTPNLFRDLVEGEKSNLPVFKADENQTGVESFLRCAYDDASDRTKFANSHLSAKNIKRFVPELHREINQKTLDDRAFKEHFFARKNSLVNIELMELDFVEAAKLEDKL